MIQRYYNNHEYIEMCEKALKLQRDWTPQKWDIFYHPSMGVGVLDDNIRNRSIDTWKDLIWLPRQDQLQGMVKNSYFFACDDFELVELFYNFVWLENPQWDKLGILSMEQLWFAYYYDLKYCKRWNGEGWIEIEKGGKRRESYKVT